MTRRGSLAIAVLSALVGSGCATTYSLQSYARGSTASIGGKLVGVMPALAAGAEHGPALVGERAANVVLSGQIRDLRFQSLASGESFGPELIGYLRRRLWNHVPVDPDPEGDNARIFKGKAAAGVGLPRETEIYLRSGGPSPTELSPEYIPPELLANVHTDYLLVSELYGTYAKLTSWEAIYGIFPIARTQQLMSTGPRGVFALYEVSSGRRVWEALVASGPAYPGAAVEVRIMPLAGAVYLLTGDIETPFGRAVQGMPHVP